MIFEAVGLGRSFLIHVFSPEKNEGSEKLINLPKVTQLVGLLGREADTRVYDTVVFTLSTGLSDLSLCSVCYAPSPGQTVAVHRPGSTGRGRETRSRKNRGQISGGSNCLEDPLLFIVYKAL